LGQDVNGIFYAHAILQKYPQRRQHANPLATCFKILSVYTEKSKKPCTRKNQKSHVYGNWVKTMYTEIPQKPGTRKNQKNRVHGNLKKSCSAPFALFPVRVELFGVVAALPVKNRWWPVVAYAPLDMAQLVGDKRGH
jgi:hypothetical protein